MKNFLSPWFRNLTALENTPVSQEFSVVDPSSDGLSTVTLAVSPSDGQSPTMVSLYFTASGVKLFEKKYQDDQDAQTEMSAMAKDLLEAAELSKDTGKKNEAKNLMTSLVTKYKRSSDSLVQPQPPVTMTQASQDVPLQYKGFRIKKLEDGSWQASQDELAFRADSLDSVKTKVDNMLRKAYGKKLAKHAGVVIQNVFIDTVDEAMEYQEKMKALQPGEDASTDGQPLWDQMQEQKEVPLPEGREMEELAPSNLAPDFKQIEKDKAKQDKEIGKRIKEQVKTEVESALEQKSASVFNAEDEKLVDGLLGVGRNWDEIKNYFIKELSKDKDATTVFIDEQRRKHGEEPSEEGLPLPPKPPTDLVSPETHDKLVKEVEEVKEPEHNFITRDELKSITPKEPKSLEDEIARADNSEIRKIALNPLQEPPAISDTPGMPLSAPIEEAPTMDAPVTPEESVEPELLEEPQSGDRVYVMGDYETGSNGYEGTMVSTYTSKGDEYAVIAKDNGANEEVAMHRVVKASQKKVAEIYYEKKAAKKCPYCSHSYEVHHSDGCTGNDGKCHCEMRKQDIDTYKEANLSKKAAIKCPKCGKEIWDYAKGYKLNKCWNCGTAFDSPEPENHEVEADLEVDSKSNRDVIHMFVNDSFPKDKMPVWGTANLKITKYPNGWALINYQTPILYRANGEDGIYFNTQKYSVTTSKIQTWIGGALSGKPVKEVDEAGIYNAIDQSNLAKDPELHPELKQEPSLESLHESALKIEADLKKEATQEFVTDVDVDIMSNVAKVLLGRDDVSFMGKTNLAWKLDLDLRDWGVKDTSIYVPDQTVTLSYEFESFEHAPDTGEYVKESKEVPISDVQVTGLNHVGWDAHLLPITLEFDGKRWSVDFGQYQRYSSQESKIEKKAVDPVPSAEGPKEVPTTPKFWKKAPEHTEREQAIPANVEQAQLVKDIESSMSSLDAIKALVTQAKAKLNEEIRVIEEKGGRFQMEAELKQKIEKLAALVQATQNQMITAGDTMVRLIQETKEHAFKPSDKQKIEWLTARLNKYEDAAKYLKQAEDGAQHLATSEEVRELYFFPRKSDQSSRLSKKANFLDTLDEVYNNVLEALKLMVGSEDPAKA